MASVKDSTTTTEHASSSTGIDAIGHQGRPEVTEAIAARVSQIKAIASLMGECDRASVEAEIFTNAAWAIRDLSDMAELLLDHVARAD